MNKDQENYMQKLLENLEKNRSENEDLKKINRAQEKLVSNLEKEVEYLSKVIRLQDTYIENAQKSNAEIKTPNSVDSLEQGINDNPRIFFDRPTNEFIMNLQPKVWLKNSLDAWTVLSDKERNESKDMDLNDLLYVGTCCTALMRSAAKRWNHIINCNKKN